MCVYASLLIHLFAFECDPEWIVYVCVWHNFLPIFFHDLNQRNCINFAGLRGAYKEPVNKSLLLLPTMPCQVHTSSQHIIINCILNHSVQLSTMAWTERALERGLESSAHCPCLCLLKLKQTHLSRSTVFLSCLHLLQL